MLLALAYSVIAIAGHGLHALAPCGDVNCGSENCLAANCVAEQMGCGCGVDHEVAAASEKSDGSPEWPALQTPCSGSQHDPNCCAFCTVLAKVKVGHSVATCPQSMDELVAAAAPAVANSPHTVRDYCHAPRGPPAAA